MTGSISSLSKLKEEEHVYIDPEDAAMLADTSIWLPSGRNLYEKPDGKSAPPSRVQSGHSSGGGRAITLDNDLDPKSGNAESTA